MTILRSVGPVISTRRSLQVGRRRGDPPVALADRSRLGQEVERPAAGVEARRRSARAARSSRRRGRTAGAGRRRRRAPPAVSTSAWRPSGARVRLAPLRASAPSIDACSSSIGMADRAASSPSSAACAAICSAQPGVGGGDRARARGEQVAGLAAAQLGRRLGLEQVVDAGRAAADLPAVGLEQLEAGDRAQQRRAAGRARPGRGPGGRRRGRRRSGGSGRRGATGSCSASSSVTSRTLAANACALGPTPGRRGAGGRSPSWPSRSRRR